MDFVGSLGFVCELDWLLVVAESVQVNITTILSARYGVRDVLLLVYINMHLI